MSSWVLGRSSSRGTDPESSSTYRHRGSAEVDGTEMECTSLVGGAPSDTNPPRFIRRWPTNRRVLGVRIQENTCNNDSSENTESSQPHTEASEKMKDYLPRFGPYYGRDEATISDSKGKCLVHVLKKTNPEDPSAARQSYLGVLTRELSDQAIISYKDITEDCSPSEFRKMMLKDGCFFLQLALLILGGGKELDYPSNNLYFGEKQDKKDIKRWIESMFFVGNQIPLFVLKILMAQVFFAQVMKVVKRKPPPTYLWCNRILFELLISPSSTLREELHCDLLHGLHRMVVGPGRPMKKLSIKGVDLEANTVVKTPVMDTNNERIFPSAAELANSCVKIKKLERGGIRGIRFYTHWFWFPSLYLPIFPIDEEAEMLFGYLRSYEEIENRGAEVSSYLRFMSDLIRTSKDVQVLRQKGIIQVEEDLNYDDGLPDMLTRLSIGKTALTDEFRILKRTISDYSDTSWAQLRGILNVVVVIAVIQTFLATAALIFQIIKK